MNLDQELYARQNRISGLEVHETATVVGCGGTGFWTALFLAMSGVKNLILIDPDTIELSNLNRLPFGRRSIGSPKVNVLSQFIFNIRPTIRIETHTHKLLEPEDCVIMRGTIYCCTDNLKSQQLVCAYANKNCLLYQRIGYDGTFLNVSKSFPLSFEEEPENAGGYTQTPSWVVPAALAAALGVSSKMYKEICIMDDIEKIGINDSTFISENVKCKFIQIGKDYILDDIDNYIPDDYGYCYDCTRIAEERDEGFLEGKSVGIEETKRLYENKISELESQIKLLNEEKEENELQGFKEGYRQAKRDLQNNCLRSDI